MNRAVSILQVLARRGPTTVTDLAHDLSIHKSTVFRLLATLESRGLVDQNSSRGRYQLGHGIVQLATGVTRKLDLSVLSRPAMAALAEEIDESVDLSVLQGDAVVTIEQVIGSAVMTTNQWVGRPVALHATSSGKLFLAEMTDEEREARLAGPLERFTDDTITDPARLRTQLDTVRRDG